MRRILGLDFTITYERFGETVTQDLRYDGSRIDVTNQQQARVRPGRRAVPHGRPPQEAVGGVCGRSGGCRRCSFVKGFRGARTTSLISGADAAIDVDDLRKFTKYENCRSNDSTVNASGPSSRSSLHPIGRRFEICDGCEARAFASASGRWSRPSRSARSRIPISALGVDVLQHAEITFPAFRLKVLKERLLTSIHSGAGFDPS